MLNYSSGLDLDGGLLAPLHVPVAQHPPLLRTASAFSVVRHDLPELTVAVVAARTVFNCCSNSLWLSVGVLRGDPLDRSMARKAHHI